MAIGTLIQMAASGTLTHAAVENACAELRVSYFELCDVFAGAVAERFLSGDYSREFCDSAMNSLFTYAHPVSKLGLPPFAFETYCVFDEGEYRPDGMVLSKRLISEALKKYKPNQSPEPTPGSVTPRAEVPKLE